MSARSTGWVAVTVTVPLARSTVTDSTPSTALISAVTARWQCAHVMPVTVKVVEPMKVRGVLDSIGTPRKSAGVVGSGTSVGAGVGGSHRGNRRDFRQDRRDRAVVRVPCGGAVAGDVERCPAPRA